MNTWQPIETAPKDGTCVDIWTGSRREPDCRWHVVYGWVTDLSDDGQPGPFCVDATHWMPLPEAPK